MGWAITDGAGPDRGLQCCAFCTHSAWYFHLGMSHWDDAAFSVCTFLSWTSYWDAATQFETRHWLSLMNPVHQEARHKCHHLQLCRSGCQWGCDEVKFQWVSSLRRCIRPMNHPSLGHPPWWCHHPSARARLLKSSWWCLWKQWRIITSKYSKDTCSDDKRQTAETVQH